MVKAAGLIESNVKKRRTKDDDWHGVIWGEGRGAGKETDGAAGEGGGGPRSGVCCSQDR